MPPSSGIRPTRGSGRPKLASSRRDDDVAAEHHLEAAADRVAVDPRDHRHVERLAQRDAAEAAGRGSAQYSSPIAPLPPFMSAPSENARSPAPVSTTHAHVAIALDLAPRSLQLGSAAASIALSTSGRSMVTRATCP